MSLVAFCSAHGSPGVTATALAVAATWPEDHQCLLVEADPSGGVIAARYGLGDTPGLSSLAAVTRQGLDEEIVACHTQQLPGGVQVLVGSASAEEVAAVLRDVAGAFAAWCIAPAGVDVVVDCGRVAPASPTLELLVRADAALVMVRPSLDQLRPAIYLLATLVSSGAAPSLLLVGDSPYGPDDVAATLNVEVAGVIASDPRTAAVLSGARGTVRDLRRSPLVRSAASLAERLANEFSGSDPEVVSMPRVGQPEVAGETLR